MHHLFVCGLACFCILVCLVLFLDFCPFGLYVYRTVLIGGTREFWIVWILFGRCAILEGSFETLSSAKVPELPLRQQFLRAVSVDAFLYETQKILKKFRLVLPAVFVLNF